MNNCTFAEGKKAIDLLIKENLNPTFLKNEAETRFHIIDNLITNCFCWKKELIEVEKYQNRSYTDYELGNPTRVIWEAKKEGKYFELPANYEQKLLVDIQSLIMLSDELKEAFQQVSNYCTRRGVQVAVITNGHQIITFLATRSDGIPPEEGRCVVFSSLEHIGKEFKIAWQLLSYEGILEKRIIKFLKEGEKSIPLKLTSLLGFYPKIRYQNHSDASLRYLSELLIQDVIENRDIEEKFYKECYCESSALSKYSLLSKNILEARYASMFDDAKPHPEAISVKPSKKTYAFNPEVMSEAISKRPIILIGDVGVGKTSFVKHLMYVSAYEEFNQSIYIYIDLGSQGSLSTDLKDFVLNEIESQLLTRHHIDIKEYSFVQGVYSSDIRRFSSGIYGEYKTKNQSLYDQKLTEMLADKIKAKDRYIKDSIIHISRQQKRQIIISLDNADQRDFDVQQKTFVVGHELAKEWNAAVFISVRPHTYYKSKQSGAFSAYPSKIFTISPPRIDNVISKRLSLSLKMAEGEIPVQGLRDITLKTNELSLFLKSLIYSLSVNNEIVELLTNITGGNVRSAIELVKNFIGSPNVDNDKIINIMKSDNIYFIPVHEFSKSALLGEYSHFNPETSLAMNIFDVTYPDSKEHFLCSIILSFLDLSGNHRDKNCFAQHESIYQELQGFGFLPEQIEDSLKRMTNKKLIETSKRITYEEDETDLIKDTALCFRITSVGLYHVKKWIYTFGYLDAMVFDTPIFDSNIKDQLVLNIESFNIKDRYSRATLFKKYLLSTWREFDDIPSYFNFEELMALSNESFSRVKNAVNKV